MPFTCLWDLKGNRLQETGCPFPVFLFGLSLSYLLYIMDILKVFYVLQISFPCMCMPFIFVCGGFPDTEWVFHFYVVSSVILFFCDFGASSPTLRLYKYSSFFF